MDAAVLWISDALNSSPLSTFVMGNPYVFPILYMANYMGLCLLFGSLLVIDLRIVGFAPSVPIQKVNMFAKYTLAGFAINLLTGLLFIAGNSGRYLVNYAFWTKMAIIGLAGVNSVYFFRRIKPQLDARIASTNLSGGAHLVAWLSLVTWSCVIVLGRFMPFVEDF